MDFYDVLKARRSIRAYRPDPVPAEALARIAEAVRLAPTACNRQPFRFLAVRDPELKKKIAAATPMKFIAEAPVILAALGHASEAWQRPGDDRPIVEIDLAIAMEHAVLAATAEHLASCWICAYERSRMDAALGLDAEWTTLALSPLGIAADAPRPFVRKPSGETFEVIG